MPLLSPLPWSCQRLSAAFAKVLGALVRSSLPSRPNKVGLKCLSVRPSVRLSVLPSTKRFFDFIEIWYVSKGRRVMHDGMQYDPIQGQGHEPLKVGFVNDYLRKNYIYHKLYRDIY